MFTGIITDSGRVVENRHEAAADLSLWIETAMPLDDLAIGASVACSGVCLTAVAIDAGRFRVDVSSATVARTVPAHWRVGARLNLERALRVGDELGGHIVTGHVDGLGFVEAVRPVAGSLGLIVRVGPDLAPFLSPRGSVAVDGVSLTVNAVADEPAGTRFEVNIIPHTAALTTLADLAPGDAVNLEIDILARYLRRMQDVSNSRV